MAKIARKTQKIFGGSAVSTDLTVFGTAKSTPSYSTDVAALQSNAAYLGGYADSILTDKAPYMEDTNSLHYIETAQLAYLMQEGIPEYDSGTIYFANSIVKKVGTNILYSSLIDNNTGNVLPNSTDSNWKLLGDLNNLSGSFADTTLSNLTLATALSNLGFTDESITSDGYYILPNGLILQWKGVNVINNTLTAITFTIAFPNSCFGVFMQLSNTGAGAYGAVSTVTVSGFNAISTVSGAYYFWAIGY